MQRRKFFQNAALGGVAATAVLSLNQPRQAQASNVTGSICVTDAPYNADPDGLASSAAAFTSAMADAQTSGQVLYIPPGSYDLQAISRLDVNQLVMVGADRNLVTLIGAAGTDLLELQADAVLRLEGITFSGFDRVVRYQATDVDQVEIENCGFQNINRQVIGSGDGVDISTINRFHFNNNFAKDIGNSDASVAVVKLSADKCWFAGVHGNQIEGVGTPNKQGTTHGIYLRLATPYDDEDSRSNVSHNVIRRVENNSILDCAGIMVLGGQTVIDGNHLENVRTSNLSSVDCEGIYIKTQNGVVTGNTLKNCGGREGVIISKGRNRNDTPGPEFGSSGFDNIISGNTICQDEDLGFLTTGIAISMDGFVCSNNRIKGTFKGISIWPNVKNTIVANNQIYGLQAYGTGGHVYGITAKHPSSLQVVDNHIANLSSNTVCYGIGMAGDNLPEIYSGTLIRGNWVENISSQNMGLARAIAVNMHVNDSCNKLVIESNHVDNAGRGIQISNVSAAQHSRALNNSLTNCSLSSLNPSTGWTLISGN